MTTSRLMLALVALATAGVVASCAPSPSITPSASASPASPSVASATYRDPRQPVAARVADLLGRMTVDEKIGQLTLVEKDSIDAAGAGRAFVGGVLSGGSGNPDPNTPGAWYAMVDGFQRAALGTRLGIPILYGVDAIHGQSHVVGATIFPQPVGLGATHDAALVEEIGRATALEMAATGTRWTYAPILAVPQDIRWGRTYEAFGEDTTSVAELGSALIRGLQGADLADGESGIATAKHFLGDGGTAWGTSTIRDYHIDQGVTDVDESALRAIHLPPYGAAIDAGVRSVMVSFSSTRAGKVHADRHLLTEVLKGELGFTGFVVSDWGGVDQVNADYATAVATSISAGVDMVMVPYDYVRFQQAVRAGLERETITQERIDDAVARILTVKLEAGLFEEPMPSTPRSVVGSSADRELARRAVAASAVLLRTSAATLPIARDATGVLLAGSAADDIGTQLGGWSITWQGGTGPTTDGTTLRAALGDTLGTRLRYDATADFPAGIHAPVGVVVVAEPPYAEGFGDSATLALPALDLAVVARLRPLVDTLIVVIYSGRPVMLDDLAAADTVVAAWLPGTEASGIADVLLGTVPFAGTTPYTWPASPADAPRTGKAACDGALFPAGFGLDGAGANLGPAACP
jgi:beta-glucosidase